MPWRVPARQEAGIRTGRPSARDHGVPPRRHLPTRCPHSTRMPSSSSPTPIPCSRCARAAGVATSPTRA